VATAVLAGGPMMHRQRVRYEPWHTEETWSRWRPP